ncbi:MAG: GIY-YIG nuclease family protein [Bacteroidales bacterium]|nr:GIY-YIG nuclease family protein [Bacteroidales bacterium]
MFYTYIIYSASCDIYYKGISEDPDRRLLEHNRGTPGGGGPGPWFFKNALNPGNKPDQERRIKA